MTIATSLGFPPSFINLKHLPTFKTLKPFLKISSPLLAKSFNVMAPPKLIKGAFAHYLTFHDIFFVAFLVLILLKNGVAKSKICKICYITETKLTLLLHASLPKSF